MIAPAKIQVRFTDLDVLGHVNNNIYLSYFEMARVHYFRELLGINWDWQKFGIVIAKNEVEYLKSVLLQHEPQITVFTAQLGTKSFTLSYELRVNNEVYAKGQSVQVCFDATTQSSIPIPDQMRFALEKIIKE
ncbi:MAG: acyl-CoA thioesterase [Crocinitomicaceae bacterium]|nr:acyl-CoA thioesterase [Crocinitomicaceae bacterium]